MDIFKSPKLLLKEAQSHIEEIDALITHAFRDCKAIRFNEIDGNTGNKIFKARLSRIDIPDRVNYLASSVINDLRHSLDQAACASITALTGASAANNIYFPIATNLTDLNGRLTKDFPEPIHESFRSIAPYPTGNDILLLLAKTANDKHTNICDVSGRITGFSINGTMTGVVNFTDPVWDYAKNEVMLCITGPDGEFNCDISIAPQITFNKTRSIDGQPIIPFLRTASEAVQNAIITIEANSI